MSINRLIDLINNKIDGEYGLGNKRTLKDFEYLAGVDLIERKVINKEKHSHQTFFHLLPGIKKYFTTNQTRVLIFN